MPERNFGPSNFESLSQGSQAREVMIEAFRTATLGQKENPVIPQVIEPKFDGPWSLLRRLPPSVRKPIMVGGTLTSLFLMALTPEECQKLLESGETPEGVRTEEPVLPLDRGLWRYTGGPHSTDKPNDAAAVRNGIDLAPHKRMACPGPTPNDVFVVASADGEVVTVGDEDDRQDPNHSVVEIKHQDGLITGYMHLDNIQVGKGEKVNDGDRLGNPSCEFRPGGATRGVHLHFYVKGADGKPLPIDGLVFSGWKVVGVPSIYNGLLIKEGEEVRTADTRVCGPDDASIATCGGIRNDIPVGVGDEVSVTPTPTKVASRTPTKTPTKSPTKTATFIPTRTPVASATFTPSATATPRPTLTPTVEITPTPTSGSGEFVLVLDGRGDGVRIEDSESLDITEGITIEARVRLKGGPDGDGGDTVLAKGTSSEPYALWATFFKCDDRKPAAFFDGVTWVCGDEVVPTGTWVNLAMTYDKNQVIFYLGGRVVGVKSLAGGLNPNDQPAFIGRSPVPIDEDLAGEVAWVALFSRARTGEEINSDFASEGGPVGAIGDASLVGLWLLDGDYSDYSGSGNHGVPLGDAHFEVR